MVFDTTMIPCMLDYCILNDCINATPALTLLQNTACVDNCLLITMGRVRTREIFLFSTNKLKIFL